MEDVATQYFGLQVSSYRVEELARDTEATLKLKGMPSAEILPAVAALRQRSDLFFDLFPKPENRSNFDNRESFLKYTVALMPACSTPWWAWKPNSAE